MAEKQVRRVVRKSPQNIGNSKVKQGSKLGLKGILFFFFGLILIIVGAVFFFFFYLVKNPNKASSLGFSPETIKSISTTFAAIFFGTFFLLFLVLGLINLYKLATKPTGKFKYGMATFIIFILGSLNLGFAFYVFTQIFKIDTNQGPNTQNLLIANAIFSDPNDAKEAKYVALYNSNYPLIAPIDISYQFNYKVFQTRYLPVIRNQEGSPIQPVKLIVDCGNGQKLTYTSYKFSPNKYCLYMKKGDYTAKLYFVYNTKTSRNKKKELDSTDINIISNLVFKSPYKLNDKKTEIIAGQAQDTVKLDTSPVPIDLGLDQNNLLIDFEDTDKFENVKGIATHTYYKDGLYFIRVKIPNNPGYPIYRFPIRILASTRPTCSIEEKNIQNKYIFIAKGKSPNGPIVKYNYAILNLTTNTVKKGRGNIIKTYLQDGNNYQIKFIIKDSKGNQGTCSTNIDLTDKITYKYTIKVNGKTLSGNEVKVYKIPSSYKINIANIQPSDQATIIGFDLDGDGQVDEKGDTTSITINNKQNKTIWAIVGDNYGNISKTPINFVIDLKPVIANLKVDKYKGSAPLTVKFDASASQVNTSGDSIAFFNWDFGDGNQENQTRKGVIQHTYKKPGLYIAKVTIETDQGFTDIAKKKIIVYKPINSATIYFPQNMGGQGQVGESIIMQLNTNGPVKSINWDFGDGNTFSCEGRDCTSITHTYDKPGLFTVHAIINYLDGSPSSQATAKINIIQ